LLGEEYPDYQAVDDIAGVMAVMMAISRARNELRGIALEAGEAKE